MSHPFRDVSSLKKLKRDFSRLDPDARRGAYEIDGLIPEIGALHQRLLPEQVELSFLREVVSSVGETSISATLKDLLAPREYEQTKKLYDWLEELRDESKRASRFRHTNVSSYLPALMYLQDLETYENASNEVDAALGDLLAKIEGVAAEVDSFLRSHPIARRGSAAEPLTNNFMMMMAIAWAGLAGRWLGSDDRSLFGRLLVAAWKDLRFPQPVDRDGADKPVEDHFRERLTKVAFDGLYRDLRENVSKVSSHWQIGPLAEIAAFK